MVQQKLRERKPPLPSNLRLVFLSAPRESVASIHIGVLSAMLAYMKVTDGEFVSTCTNYQHPNEQRTR